MILFVRLCNRISSQRFPNDFRLWGSPIESLCDAFQRIPMVRLSTRISSQRFPNDDWGYIVKNVLQANSQANTEKLFRLFFMFLWMYARSGGWIHKKLWGETCVLQWLLALWSETCVFYNGFSASGLTRGATSRAGWTGWWGGANSKGRTDLIIPRWFR